MGNCSLYRDPTCVSGRPDGLINGRPQGRWRGQNIGGKKLPGLGKKPRSLRGNGSGHIPGDFRLRFVFPPKDYDQVCRAGGQPRTSLRRANNESGQYFLKWVSLRGRTA